MIDDVNPWVFWGGVILCIVLCFYPLFKPSFKAVWKCFWQGHDIVCDEDGWYCEDCKEHKNAHSQINGEK